jgi:hypothetical protein
MFKSKIAAAALIAAALFVTIQTAVPANAGAAKKHAVFTVRIENISVKDGLTAADGSKYPFALSPGFFSVTKMSFDLFKTGTKASAALEAQAEDGDPSMLLDAFQHAGVTGTLQVFNTPVGGTMPSPILPGGAYEFTFYAVGGMKLNLATMYGQSNDLFYAPAGSIALFDKNGNPLSGDITGELQLWDAGTEVNQAPGIGADQGPRQAMKNTGAAENGVVGLVNDAFTYPAAKDVLRVTVTAK